MIYIYITIIYIYILLYIVYSDKQTAKGWSNLTWTCCTFSTYGATILFLWRIRVWDVFVSKTQKNIVQHGQLQHRRRSIHQIKQCCPKEYKKRKLTNETNKTNPYNSYQTFQRSQMSRWALSESMNGQDDGRSKFEGRHPIERFAKLRAVPWSPHLPRSSDFAAARCHKMSQDVAKCCKMCCFFEKTKEIKGAKLTYVR